MAYLLRVHDAQPRGLEFGSQHPRIKTGILGISNSGKDDSEKDDCQALLASSQSRKLKQSSGRDPVSKEQAENDKGYIIFSFGLSSINRHCTCTFMSSHVHHTCASHIWVPPKVKKKQIGLFFKRKFKRRCCLFCFSNANDLRDER